MRLLGTLLWMLGCNNAALDVENSNDLIGDSDRPAWDPDAQTIDNSSSSSTVAWTPPDEEDNGQPTHYQVTVTSEFGAVVFSEKVTDTTVTVDALRTDTAYSIDILACYDPDCDDALIPEFDTDPTWRTEIESWYFPQIEGGSISPLMENAYAPTLINLSTFSDDYQGWLLTTLQQGVGGQQIQISTLRNLLVGDDDNAITFDLETPYSAGLQDVPSVLEFTSSSARPVKIDGNWTLQLFVSVEAPIVGERSMIGSWTSDLGIESIDLYDDSGNVCEMSSLDEVCGMNTCMDSNSDDLFSLNRMECISIIPNTDNRMLVQGRAESNDNSPSNLYVIESIGNGEWSALGDMGATPLIKDATGASVHLENGVGKLYYWDENTGTAYIRYWDPQNSGNREVLELSDLESVERVRNVYYKDRSGETMLPWNFRVVERAFVSFPNKEVMLATVENGDGERHITFGVLQNP